jgi:hypothetical protein
MADTVPPKPKPKFAFSGRPDWLKASEAKPAPTKPKDDDDDLFGRSRDTYDDIIKRQEQRKKEKEAKKRASEEQREAKRRRISDDNDTSLGSMGGRESTESDELEDTKFDSLITGATEPKNEQKRTPVVIDLDDLDDDDLYVDPSILDDSREVPMDRLDSYGVLQHRPLMKPTRSSPRTRRFRREGYDEDGMYNLVPPLKPKQKAGVVEIPDDDPDDDLDPELVARARARARQMQATGGAQSTSTASSNAVIQTATTPDEPDPIISILIQPRIPDTEPLLVKRRYRQRIKECREAWCARENQASLTNQGISTVDVILTYRGRRIFDISTLKTLGIELDANGEPIMPSNDGAFDQPGDKIALVATTTKLMEEDLKAEEERQRREEMGEPEQPEEVIVEKPKEQTIRIILKSKDLPDKKLIVKPVSHIGIMTPLILCSRH